jgi:hypothetical protein
MAGERAKTAPPNSPAPASTTAPPTGNEQTTDAGASPSPPRGFREARLHEYGKDYVIGGAVGARTHQRPSLQQGGHRSGAGAGTAGSPRCVK